MASKLRVETHPLTDILPDPDNLNKHTQAGQRMLESSLSKRGFFRGMGAAGKGTDTPVMVAGNLTQEVAISIGMEDAIIIRSDGTKPIVHVRTDLDPDSEEAKVLALEDNRIGQVSLDFDTARLLELSALGGISEVITDSEITELIDRQKIIDEGYHREKPEKEQKPDELIITVSVHDVSKLEEIIRGLKTEVVDRLQGAVSIEA